jgi:hypothetical protein
MNVTDAFTLSFFSTKTEKTRWGIDKKFAARRASYEIPIVIPLRGFA